MFQFYLCKLFNRLPSDSFFEEMNPFEKLWLYESWVNELEEKAKFNKSLAILTGGFYNPQLAQKMLKDQDPDYSLSDDEFEESWRIVKEGRKNIQPEEDQEEDYPKRKRPRRRKVVR